MNDKLILDTLKAMHEDIKGNGKAVAELTDFATTTATAAIPLALPVATTTTAAHSTQSTDTKMALHAVVAIPATPLTFAGPYKMIDNLAEWKAWFPSAQFAVGTVPLDRNPNTGELYPENKAITLVSWPEIEGCTFSSGMLLKHLFVCISTLILLLYPPYGFYHRYPRTT
jgi:hypothetical protein